MTANAFSERPRSAGTANDAPPLVILGAGYAGVRLAHELSRGPGRRLPTTLVDRHPFHVIRTELYEVGKIARRGPDLRRWAVPIDRVVGAQGVTYREGSVERIDLERSEVVVGSDRLPYRGLAICLGSVPAYYGVPGAKAATHQVYGLLGAIRLAEELKRLEATSADFPRGRRPRIVVVGGGSTGVEVAAEIATADWRRIVGRSVRHPSVTLICGALPFLAGLDAELVAHARALLGRAGVEMNEGSNVTRVEPGSVTLANGRRLSVDLVVWAAGVEAPAVVRALTVPHGRAGRVAVGPTLEVPGYPGVFAVGDVAEVQDPRTGGTVPATAQAALAEAPVAAENLLRRSDGRELKAFRYRERGVIVAAGQGRAAARWNRVLLWGSPAGLLKSVLDREYRVSSQLGRESSGY